MVKHETITKYNNLMDKRIELSDEIERISNTLLSDELTKQTQNDLLNKLNRKIKEYEQVANELRHFKFE